jgi:uncharacterized protein HemX
MELLAALIIGAALWLWTARPSRTPARAVRTSQEKLALVTFGAATPAASGAHVQPPRAERRPGSEPERTPAPPADRLRSRPISLGVAAILQLVGLCATCVLGALLVLRMQLDTRAQLQAVELRASQRVAQAEAAAERAQAELRSLQSARRAQDDETFRLQARISQLEQQCRPADKPARASSTRARRGH